MNHLRIVSVVLFCAEGGVEITISLMELFPSLDFKPALLLFDLPGHRC